MGRYPRARYKLGAEICVSGGQDPPLDGQVTRSYKGGDSRDRADLDRPEHRGDDEEIPQWACQDSEEDGWGDEEGQR